jgi:hypothetical protein
MSGSSHDSFRIEFKAGAVTIASSNHPGDVATGRIEDNEGVVRRLVALQTDTNPRSRKRIAILAATTAR